MLPNPPTERLSLDGSQHGAPAPGSAHFREMAQRLRYLARDCRFPGARREMLDLAASFDRRADYFDWRQAFQSSSEPRCYGVIEPVS
jgi:hypothetical protein